MKTDKTKIRRTLLNVLKIAVAAALFITAVINYDKLVNIDIRSLTENADSFIAASAAVELVYLIKAILFVIPAMLIYVSVGMAFSPAQALLINLVGICLEVSATYFLGKFLGGNAVEKLLKGKKGADKLLNMKDKGKLSILFAIRFLPVFPIDFSSLILGASGIPFIKYFIISVLGIMPRVALFTLLGDSIYDYIPMKLIVTAVIIAIPVAVCVTLITKSVKKRKNVSCDKNNFSE